MKDIFVCEGCICICLIFYLLTHWHSSFISLPQLHISVYTSGVIQETYVSQWLHLPQHLHFFMSTCISPSLTFSLLSSPSLSSTRPSVPPSQNPSWGSLLFTYDNAGNFTILNCILSRMKFKVVLLEKYVMCMEYAR